MSIYIPIWLDLLYKEMAERQFAYTNLHSNMVRFIIPLDVQYERMRTAFTFQYG